MNRSKKSSPPPVNPRLNGVRRVSRSTVVATSATIAADKRLAALLGDDELVQTGLPEPGDPLRMSKTGRRRRTQAERDADVEAWNETPVRRARYQPPDMQAAVELLKASVRPEMPDQPVRRRGVNGRAKGKTGELEFKDLLREHGWADARRGQQRSGVDQADVIGGPPGVHFEVKRVEALNVWAAFEQAERDAPAGTTPVVAMRRNRSRWLAVLPIEVLLELLRRDGRAEKALDTLLE